MTNKDDDELTLIAARTAEIRAGLDAAYSKEELQRPLSRRTVHALVAAMTAVTAAKLGALAARVEAIEDSGIRYRGNFQRASAYWKGDTVTHSGSLWVALKAVPEGAAPGSNPASWQLASKGGKPIAQRERKKGKDDDV